MTRRLVMPGGRTVAIDAPAVTLRDVYDARSAECERLDARMDRFFASVTSIALDIWRDHPPARSTPLPTPQGSASEPAGGKPT